MTDYKCICGNKTNNMCSLKCCKNCCNSMYCLEHNPTDILKCDKTMCFICGDTKYSNDFIALCNNLYYCNSCSINNREIFSSRLSYHNTDTGLRGKIMGEGKVS